MSCYVLSVESFEALAASLAAFKVKVPSAHAPALVATPEAWAALARAASESNAIAYAHRYREPAVTPHPLEAKHGSYEAWETSFKAWCAPLPIRMGGPRPRSEVALVKLLVCLAYQIADAPTGSEAATIGQELHRLSAELALAMVARSDAYQAAPWGDDAREVWR